MVPNLFEKDVVVSLVLLFAIFLHFVPKDCSEPSICSPRLRLTDSIKTKENFQSYQAQSGGFIHFVNNLVPGSAVKKGDVLFEIQGGILTDENYDLKFHEIKLEYEKNKMNYERASELIKDRIVSEEKFLEIKTNFKNAEARYFVYLENRNQNGQKVLSKTTGYIHQIYVSEGKYMFFFIMKMGITRRDMLN